MPLVTFAIGLFIGVTYSEEIKDKMASKGDTTT